MMNGFALLVAVAVMGQNGGTGWEVDKQDQQLQYVIHLTPQEITGMQPTAQKPKPEESLVPVLPSLHGRFSKVLIRIDSASPARYPSEEEVVRGYPSLVQNSLGAKPNPGALKQMDDGGWEIDKEDKKLNYVIHLTPQDVIAMQNPRGPNGEVEECVVIVPQAIQGRFSRIVVRIDGSVPPRFPTEDQVALQFPSLLSNAATPGFSNLAQPNLASPANQTPSNFTQSNLGTSGFANIDSDRDRNAAPPVRTTGAANSATLSDVAQKGLFNSNSLASQSADRNRDAPNAQSGVGSLSSAPLGNGTQSTLAPPASNGLSNTGLYGNNSLNSNIGQGNNGFSGTGLGTLNNTREPPSLSGTNGIGSGYQGQSLSSATNPGYSTNPGYGTNSSQLNNGSLNNYGSTYGQNPYGNQSSTTLGNTMNQSNPYASNTMGYSNPNTYGNTVSPMNNGFGASANPFNTNFQTQGGLASQQYPLQGVAPAYTQYNDPYRMAALQTPTVQQPPATVPFPTTSGPTTVPPSLNSGYRPRNNNSLSGASLANSEYETTGVSYLPIFFLLSFVVNLYAGIYLYKLRDRHRNLLSSVRAGIES